MTIKLSQHAGGGETRYDPGMMTFDGSTGYYSLIGLVQPNQALTAIIRFNIASFSGGSICQMLRIGTTSTIKLLFYIGASDHATVDRRNKLACYVQDSTGATACLLYSKSDVADGADHTAFFSYDASAGTALLYVDGVDEDDTGNAERVLGTATLATDSGNSFVGASPTPSQYVDGDIGYVGYRNAYLTNPTDFYHPTNGLQELDESTWREWGAQPLFWHPTGKMDENLGSAGDMTANGTIELSPPNTLSIPHLGLNTIGDAVVADIMAGKVAWVDGEQIVGTKTGTSQELTITNPDAEEGDYSGWTVESGSWRVLGGGYSGSYCFAGGQVSGESRVYQDISLVTGNITQDLIDDGLVSVICSWQQSSYSGSDKGTCRLEFYDDTTLLLTADAELKAVAATNQDTWHLRHVGAEVPATTTKVRLIMVNERVAGTNCDGYIDALTLKAIVD